MYLKCLNPALRRFYDREAMGDEPPLEIEDGVVQVKASVGKALLAKYGDHPEGFRERSAPKKPKTEKGGADE